MILCDYIGAIKNVITTHSQTKLVIDLFKSAGAVKDVEESTARSWLSPCGSKRYRKCKITKYFPKHELKGNYFIEFLRTRINTSWRELQKAFHSIKDDCIVDLETNNEELFYWSLLNQFEKIHGLPLSKNPTADALTASLSAPDNTQGEVVAQNETPPVQEYTLDLPKIFDRETLDLMRKGPMGVLKAHESIRSKWAQPLKLKPVKKK